MKVKVHHFMFLITVLSLVREWLTVSYVISYTPPTSHIPFANEISQSFLIGHMLAEPRGCSKAGIYPGSSSREFVVCTAGGALGTQLVQTKHNCSVNMVYRNHQCVPTLIMPYTAVSKKEAADGGKQTTNDDISVTCKTFGLLCTSCHQLSICIGEEDQSGRTKYHQRDMAQCAADQVCAPGHGCAPNNITFCPYRKFQCSDIGIYPDPYDCTVYYRCEPTTAGYRTVKMKCKEGSFNPATASCGYRMSTNACLTTPVPLCQSIFQMGPVPDNLRIYYICIPNYVDHTLAPSLHSCPANLRFDIKTLTCS